MSENLTISNLSFLLGELSSHWYEIGIHLKLRKGVLDTIGRDFKNTSYRCMIEMFDSWLLRGEGCTWSTIKKMLREMGNNAEAKRIDHYIPELQRIVGKQGKHNQHCQRLVPMPDRCYEDWWLERFHFINDRLSHYPDPTLEEWIKELSLDTKTFLRVVSIYWYRIGIALRIPKSKLDRIKALYDDCDQRLQRMFTAWQRIGYNCSWRKLIETFNELNFGDVAINIEHAARRQIKDGSRRVEEFTDEHWENIESQNMKLESLFKQKRLERDQNLFSQFRDILQADNAHDKSSPEAISQLITKEHHTQDDIMNLISAVGVMVKKFNDCFEVVEKAGKDSSDYLESVSKVKAKYEKKKQQLHDEKNFLLHKKVEIKNMIERIQESRKVDYKKKKKLEDELDIIEGKLNEWNRLHSHFIDQAESAEIVYEKAAWAVSQCIEELQASKKELECDREYVKKFEEKENKYYKYFIMLLGGARGGVFGGAAGAVAGMIIGIVGGPPGMAFGSSVGGMVGGAAGIPAGAVIALNRYQKNLNKRTHDDITSNCQKFHEDCKKKLDKIEELIKKLENVHQ